MTIALEPKPLFLKIPAEGAWGHKPINKNKNKI